MGAWAVNGGQRNVTQFPSGRVHSGNGGNGGRFDRLQARLDRFDERLRVVEGDLKRIDEKLGNCATKSDIDKLKIWALVGALVGMSGVLAWIFRFIAGAGDIAGKLGP